jgi:ribosomal protein S18 acetylase RimI-like enzyme
VDGLEIARLASDDEAAACARLMSGSEPWISLGTSYEQSLERILDPTREVYVARAGGELVGFVVLVPGASFVGYIQSVVTVPEWRGKGIGTSLMTYAEERIFRENPNVFVLVSSANTRARALYERLGYTAVGELEDFIVAGDSEVLMRKSIGTLSEFSAAGDPDDAGHKR